MFEIITDEYSRKPMEAQAVLWLVPTFILLKELHLLPKCATELDWHTRRRDNTADLKVVKKSYQQGT